MAGLGEAIIMILNWITGGTYLGFMGFLVGAALGLLITFAFADREGCMGLMFPAIGGVVGAIVGRFIAEYESRRR